MEKLLAAWEKRSLLPYSQFSPVMQWFKGDRIKSVQCVGTGSYTAPQFRQEDTSLTLCQMESGKLIKIRIDCISERPHNMTYYSLQGTKGVYEAPRGLGDDHKIWLKGMDDSTDTARWRPLKDFYDQYMPERYKHVTEEQKLAGHWGGDYFIVKDFIDAIVIGEKPAIDVYEACEWTAVGLLSELSIMNGGRSIDMPNFKNCSNSKDQIIKL